MSLRSQTPKTVPVSLRGASAAHTNQNETTIPGLVSELRATFLTRDFDRVERALLERESRLVAAIQEKDQEIASLKVKDSIHSLDKLNLESQLKEFRNGGSKVFVEVKKEENVDSDLSGAGKCMHCLEMKNELEKEKGVSESLRDRNMQLEFEKSELLEERKKWDDQRCVVDDLKKRNIELEAEKFGLLEEKKKWDDAKGGIDGLSEEERNGADEASVEYWKRKFIELSERLEREAAEDDDEDDDDNDDDDDDGGGGGGGGDDGDGSNIEENKTGAEKVALERNENVGLSSRDSATLIIPSKDGAGVTAASAKGSLGTAGFIYIDSDEDECNSQRTLQRKDTKPKVMADNEILSSSGAVKRKQRPSASISDVGRNNDVLDGSDCDTASNSCSSSGSLYDMDQLPLSSLTSKKRMRTEPDTLLVRTLHQSK
ncbi:uncharacterized protein DS421_1g02730 [Arachis hypogaea]|nr:uncharacterized protein DS421_1g02730 [Arachis hypogaea]